MNQIPDNANRPAIVPAGVQWTAYSLVLLLAVWGEVWRWLDEESRRQALTGWFCGPQADWLPLLMLLLPAPWLWKWSRRRVDVSSSGWLWANSATSRPSLGFWTASALMFLLAFVICRITGQSQAHLPPAYHDEYSYLFQAETFRQGRWWFPSDSSIPHLFDQMHVLNEGRFASRYFPGTGLWLVPFVSWGDPWLGPQVAQGLCAMLLYWIGREFSSNAVGLLAGGLLCVAPGLVLFGNLLLSHHPTLVGLLLFLWAFLRWMRVPSHVGAIVAGIGLAWGMLCRPLTAAGFAFPFGVVFVWWWISGTMLLGGRTSDSRAVSPFQRTAHAVCLGLPLLAGMGGLLWSNLEITGSLWRSPYQEYTDLYTPRHVYGFNNVIRGERQAGPRTLENYDRWAENLTPALAVDNVRTRLANSLRWSLGIVPLALGAFIVLLTLRRGSPKWGLIWLSIVCLHAVYFPYWFSGIMGWHYVFETAPLWLLLFAEGSCRLVATWRSEGRRGMIWLWGAMILLSVTVNLVTVSPLWPARLASGLAEVEFPRRRYADFRQQVEEWRNGRPVLVLVIPDPYDRSMDYVTNPPDLAGPVLVGRLRNENPEEIARHFSDRRILIFDAATGQLRPYEP